MTAAQDPAYEVLASAEDQEKWLALRRTLITATDVPSIIGVPGEPHLLDTWYRKQEALEGRAFRGEEAMRMGHLFEDFNAQMYARATGHTVHRSQHLCRSTRWPWLGCTLDYRRSAPPPSHYVPLELKNAGGFTAGDLWPEDGEPALAWQVQLHTQMLVCNTSQGSLSAWIGSPYVHHRWRDMERHDELCSIIREETEKFWDSLQRGVPPEHEPSPAVYDVLRRLSKSFVSATPVALPADLELIDRMVQKGTSEIEKLRQELRAREAVLKALEAEIATSIGNHESGVLPNGVQWSFRNVEVPARVQEAYSYRLMRREMPK